VATRQRGDAIVLLAGDALFVGVCVEGGFRNDGAEPVSFLVAAVTNLAPDTCPSASPVAAGDGNPGLTVQFLAVGTIDPPAALPARIGITRLTYAPGATHPQTAANDGTVLGYVESGTFGMTIESGKGTVIRKPANPSDFFAAQQDPLIEGVEETLNPGDLVWQQSGTVFQARNPGADAATVFIMVLDAATADTATPTG
jgi:quercetin dioxygenase-like cupin family protein